MVKSEWGREDVQGACSLGALVEVADLVASKMGGHMKGGRINDLLFGDEEAAPGKSLNPFEHHKEVTD